MKVAQVRNETKGTSLGEVRVLRSAGSRLLGLMGRKSLPEGRGVLIDPCNSIHTMFMRFPIDVIFLDANHRVLKIAPALRPYRLSIARGSKRVLELAPGAAAEAAVAEGDLLSITET